jgi:hypothetical protein
MIYICKDCKDVGRKASFKMPMVEQTGPQEYRDTCPTCGSLNIKKYGGEK